jgi:hypothetical protein
MMLYRCLNMLLDISESVTLDLNCGGYSLESYGQGRLWSTLILYQPAYILVHINVLSCLICQYVHVVSYRGIATWLGTIWLN